MTPAATKNRKSPEQLALLTANAFAPCKLAEIAELDQGLFNAAYAIRLDDGRRLVLKIAPPQGAPLLRHEWGVMRSEVDSMTLAFLQAHIPVPKVLQSDFTCTQCDAPYFFMEYVPGVSFLHQRQAMTEQEQGQIEKELGAYARSIHAIAGAGFGYVRNPLHQSWPESFLSMLDDVLLDVKRFNASLPVPEEELRGLILPFLPLLSCIKTPCLLHGDLWDGNILIQDGHICAILDFERALWGDPLMEFPFSGEIPMKNFLDGYEKEIWKEPAAHQRRVLYNLYFYLVLLVECACRDNGNKGQGVWAAAKLRKEIRKLRNFYKEGGQFA